MTWKITLRDPASGKQQEIEVEAADAPSAIGIAHGAILRSGSGQIVASARQVSSDSVSCYWCSKIAPLSDIYSVRPGIHRPDGQTSVLDGISGHEACLDAALARLYAKTVEAGETVEITTEARA